MFLRFSSLGSGGIRGLAVFWEMFTTFEMSLACLLVFITCFLLFFCSGEGYNVRGVPVCFLVRGVAVGGRGDGGRKGRTVLLLR